MSLHTFRTVTEFVSTAVVPDQGRTGTWVGRVWVPAAMAADGLAGPRVVVLREGRIWTTGHQTMAALINDTATEGLSAREGECFGDLDEVLENSLFFNRVNRLQDENRVVLLAPNDILATKACGVTFVRSLLERVIEEKARGDASRAGEIRAMILDTLGDDLSRVIPGSPETDVLKERLIRAGIWSQYLEVGIGKDAEVFTKHQPMASVTYGNQIGVLPDSKWNNPEPEIVLAVSNRGVIRGATLGNDVNLRDYEGRSALLLGEAKDQNGSCSIGPFIRLFDETFGLDAITRMEVELQIVGEDGFSTGGRNRMSEISRSPEALVAQAIGRHHQYPDGLVLFLGTMFAPTADRGGAGEGFTHHVGDRVEISTESLGKLVNWVNHTDAIPRWEYGVTELINYLVKTKTKS
ncbi:MAG: fumarylacetoacetate hydrolase family protein [Opitutaceae bacterium]